MSKDKNDSTTPENIEYVSEKAEKDAVTSQTQRELKDLKDDVTSGGSGK